MLLLLIACLLIVVAEPADDPLPLSSAVSFFLAADASPAPFPVAAWRCLITMGSGDQPVVAKGVSWRRRGRGQNAGSRVVAREKRGTWGGVETTACREGQGEAREGVASIRDDQHVEEGKVERARGVRTWPRRGERARRGARSAERPRNGRRSVENRAASEARKEAQLDVWKHNGVEISWRRASRVMESKGRREGGRGEGRGRGTCVRRRYISFEVTATLPRLWPCFFILCSFFEREGQRRGERGGDGEGRREGRRLRLERRGRRGERGDG